MSALLFPFRNNAAAHCSTVDLFASQRPSCLIYIFCTHPALLKCEVVDVFRICLCCLEWACGIFWLLEWACEAEEALLLRTDGEEEAALAGGGGDSRFLGSVAVVHGVLLRLRCAGAIWLFSLANCVTE